MPMAQDTCRLKPAIPSVQKVNGALPLPLQSLQIWFALSIPDSCGALSECSLYQSVRLIEYEYEVSAL